LRSSLGFAYDRGRVMAADVVETAEHIVISTDDSNGLAGDFSRDIFARMAKLLGAPGKLPAAGKNPLTL
jgi:hypothetical protein